MLTPTDLDTVSRSGISPQGTYLRTLIQTDSRSQVHTVPGMAGMQILVIFTPNLARGENPIDNDDDKEEMENTANNNTNHNKDPRVFNKTTII